MPAAAQQPYLLMSPAVHQVSIRGDSVHPTPRSGPTSAARTQERVGVSSPELLHSKRRDALAMAAAIVADSTDAIVQNTAFRFTSLRVSWCSKIQFLQSFLLTYPLQSRRRSAVTS